MRTSLLLAGLILSLVLSACGGGGGGDTTTVQPPADTTAPTVTFTVSASAAQPGQPMSLTVAFSEPVGGFTVGDLVVTGATLDSFLVLNAQTYAASYIAGGSGVMDISVAAGSCIDLVGNALAVGTATQVTIADTIAPSAALILSTAVVQPGQTVSLTVAFTEPVIGFTAGDLVVTGGALDSFLEIDARTYVGACIAGGSGVLSLEISVVTDACADLAGNHLAVGTSTQVAIAYAPWASALGRDGFGVWADLVVSGNGETAVQRFRLIPAGTFTQGSPVDEPWREPITTPDYLNCERQAQVTISQHLWMADSECSQRLWKAITGGTPGTATAAGLDLPVETVDWPTVSNFIVALNGAAPQLQARLPTEAQWEYAARAGVTSAFCLGQVGTATINCRPVWNDPYVASGTNRGSTLPVRSLIPNPWGLYDIHGNVWEWCADRWQGDRGSDPKIDPVGPASGTNRALRGGSFRNQGTDCRSASRYYDVPGTADPDLGFRLSAPAYPVGSG